MLKKILVTGGTGFLGAYIIRELVEKGYLVRAIRRRPALPFFIPQEIMEKVEWVDGDVLDVVSLDSAMKDIDAVIHSAAIISFLKKERNNMYQVNVEGTSNVVNLALENNVRRLVHISSIAAVGRTAGGEQVTEEKKWTESRLNTHYAISKRKAEIEVWRGAAEGLDMVILNPSTIIGFGDWGYGSGAIFKNIYREFPWYTRGLNGFVDVSDVAKITVMMMESPICNERFIINGDNWEFRRLFNTIAAGFGKKPPYREATPFLSSVAWRLEKVKSLLTGKKPLLTKETTRIALSKTWWMNDKIRKTFPGFSFTPLDQSIRQACQKYEQAIRDRQLKE